MMAQALETEYPVVMTDMAHRLVACQESLSELLQNAEHPASWKNVDFISVQIRKICELITLGSIVAHFQIGQREVSIDEWHPKNCLSQVTRFNEFPLPVPIDHELLSSGSNHLMPSSKPLPASVICSIYGKCGNFLHIGSASQFFRRTMPPFDLSVISGWIDGLIVLLKAHLLMLPGLDAILLCRWGGKADVQPEVWLMKSDGPAIFDTSNLPDFSLLVP